MKYPHLILVWACFLSLGESQSAYPVVYDKSKTEFTLYQYDADRRIDPSSAVFYTEYLDSEQNLQRVDTRYFDSTSGQLVRVREITDYNN